MECKFLGIDIQDNQGRHEVGYMENTVRGKAKTKRSSNWTVVKLDGHESGQSSKPALRYLQEYSISCDRHVRVELLLTNLPLG